jgi:hypothetical protein
MANAYRSFPGTINLGDATTHPARGCMRRPLYVVVGLLQVVFRDGFDFRRRTSPRLDPRVIRSPTSW